MKRPSDLSGALARCRSWSGAVSLRRAGALVVLALLSGCAQTPRRVILISIDTLRADHLGLYGYPRPTSPVLDELADGSLVFEDATSASPWTLPAHGTLLTGLYPSRHGLKSHRRYLPATVPTLASRLAREGYVTAAAVNSHNLSSRYGLDRGFQEFFYEKERARQRKPSARITDQAMEWLTAYGKGRLFLFLHYFDVHSDYRSLPSYESQFVRPYQGEADGSTAQLVAFREGRVSLDSEDAAHLIDLYDAGIRQMDDELGRLLAFLRENELLEQSLLVVTSDHGEEFLDHGGVLHGRTQFQELVRVPLLFRGPGIPTGRRVRTPVSLVDVVPTLLSILNVPVPSSLDGKDLTPLWSGGEEEEALKKRFLFGEADHNNVEHDITRSVRHQHFKLHYDRLTDGYALYDLSQDPEERLDIAGEHPRASQQLLSHLRRFLETRADEAPVLELSPEEIQRLKSLGYLK